MYLVELMLPMMIFNFCHLSLASKIFGEKINIKSLKNIFIFFVLTIAVTLSAYVFESFLRSAINFLFVFAAYYLIFHNGANKTFIVSFVVFAIFFICEILLSIALILFFGDSVTAAALKSIPLLSMSNLVIGLGSFYFYDIKFLRVNIENWINSYEKYKFTVIILVILFTLCVLANKNFLSMHLSVQYVLNILMVVLFCLIIYLLLKEKNDGVNLSKRYEHLFNYLSNYEKELTKKSMVIHEFENQLIAIKGYNAGNNKDLENYIDTIINDTKTGETKLLKDMEHIPNGGLKGLIYYKLDFLSEEGIKVSTSISSNVKKNIFKDINPKINKHILKIVGILLDNAIESARESKEKQISLEIYCQKGTLFFILSNTYGNKINLDRLDEIGYSSKGKGRGYGLALAKKIISENSFIHLEKQVIGNYFIATLSIETKNISNIN